MKEDDYFGLFGVEASDAGDGGSSTGMSDGADDSAPTIPSAAAVTPTAAISPVSAITPTKTMGGGSSSNTYAIGSGNNGCVPTGNVNGSAAGENQNTGAVNPDARQALSGRQPDSVYAAARRRAETEAQQRVNMILDDTFAGMGIVNPYTGQQIKSKSDYDSYKVRFDKDRADDTLAKSGLSRAELDRLLAEHPAVRRAEAAVSAVEKERAAVRRAGAHAAMEADLRQIAAIDPDVKSLGDLPKMQGYDKFYALVKQGNSLIDAYKLANYERLTKRVSDAAAASAAAAAAQQIRNGAAGKDHLNRSIQRGAGSDAVPADIEREFLALNPDSTKAEIQKYYNNYKRTTRN